MNCRHPRVTDFPSPPALCKLPFPSTGSFQVNDAVEEIKYAVEELQEGSLVRVIRYPAPAPPRP